MAAVNKRFGRHRNQLLPCFLRSLKINLKHSLKSLKYAKSIIINKNTSYETYYIWSLGYALSCDVTSFKHGIPPNYISFDKIFYFNPRYYIRPSRLRHGDLVWIASRYVEEFIKGVLPKLDKKIGLVITDGDDSFPSSFLGKCDIHKLLGSENIMSIFSQNYDGTYGIGNKVFGIPIGLDFHSINRKGGFWGSPQKSAQEQEEELAGILAGAKPVNDRIVKAYIDFHLNDRLLYDGTKRSAIFAMVNKPEIVDCQVGMVGRNELWKRKSQYLFSISPHGAGLDCHRTWEDLVLGCIVIVKKSALDPLYEGLPVAIVDSWNEITKEKLVEWKHQYSPMLLDGRYREKLKLEWWIGYMRNIVALKTKGTA